MTETFDLGPAARAVTGLLGGVTDDRLDARTPCELCPVGCLLDHLMGLTVAFTVAATKSAAARERLAGESPPGQASVEHLDPEWRGLLPRRLDDLATAWDDPSAWEGMAEAGGVTMPAEIMGTVALNELVIHGWDLARATGQAYDVDPRSAQASLAFTSASAEETHGAGSEGLFGPVVEVPADASALSRALGFSGRDPEWAP